MCLCLQVSVWAVVVEGRRWHKDGVTFHTFPSVKVSCFLHHCTAVITGNLESETIYPFLNDLIVS